MSKYSKENERITKIFKWTVIITVLLIITLVIYSCATGQQAEEPKEPEPLIIEIPETETEGSVTIYTSDGAIYGFYGDIEIINDGTDGNQITIELYGWLVESISTESRNIRRNKHYEIRITEEIPTTIKPKVGGGVYEVKRMESRKGRGCGGVHVYFIEVGGKSFRQRNGNSGKVAGGTGGDMTVKELTDVLSSIELVRITKGRGGKYERSKDDLYIGWLGELKASRSI